MSNCLPCTFFARLKQRWSRRERPHAEDAVERQGFNRRLSSIRYHYHPVTLLCPENPLKRKATHAHTKTTVQEKVYGCHKKFVANLEDKKRSITAFF